MPVKIKDIKSKSISPSSNPFQDWENEKKAAVKPGIKDNKTEDVNNPFEQYFKKKSGTEDGGTGSPPTSDLDKSNKPSVNRIPANDYSFNLDKLGVVEQVKLPDGTTINATRTSAFQNPDYVQGVNQRIQNNTLTTQDLKNLSEATGKSENVVDAYIKKGKVFGGALDHLEKEKKVNDELISTINNFNSEYGGGQFGKQYIPEQILSSPELTAQFLQSYETETKKKNAALVAKKYVEKEQEAQKLGYFDVDQKSLEAIALSETKEQLEGLKGKFDERRRLLNEHIVNTTIIQNEAKGVPKDQTISQIARLTNPQGFDEYIKAKTPQTVLPIGAASIMPALGSAYDYIAGTEDKQELMNSVKGEAELRYNDGLASMAYNKISAGIVSGDENLVNQGKAQLGRVDNEVIFRYPSLMKQEIARRVSETIARESGQTPGSTTENIKEKIVGAHGADYERVMRELGYLDNPKTRDIANSMLSDPEQWFADASYTGGMISSFVQPFKELGLSIGDITQFRNSLDILSDKKKEELFPKEIEETKTDFKLPIIGNVKVRNVLNTTANLTGMAVIATATEGIAGELGVGAKSLDGLNKIEAGEYLQKASSIKKSLGAYTSFGLPSYDAALKDSYNFLDNDAARTLYATITAVTNAEGGRLLDLGKIARIPGVSENYAKMAQGLSDKSLTKTGLKELLGEAENKYVDFAVKYGKNVTKGAATMAYFNISNNIEKLAFGDPRISSSDILPQAANAFLDGVTGMSIMGAFGAVADMRNDKNTSYKGFIYNMALNHDATADVFKQGLEKGLYTKDEYNQKMQILNTARAAKGALDLAQIDNNVLLNENQKSVYVANKTAAAVLRKQLDNLPQEKESQKGELKAQIGRLDQQNKDIMEGLKFSPTLEPYYDLFEAEKKYNQALEDVNSKSNEGDYLKVEEAKNNYDQLINKYFNERFKGKEAEKTTIPAEDFKLTDEQMSEVNPVLDKVNNAEYINENEIKKAQDVLYEVLDKNPDAAHLIEPLILKLQDYDFSTKTETRTVTEKEPVEGTFANKSKRETKPALEQSIGSEATVRDKDGNEIKGKLTVKDGNYTIESEGKEPFIIGETQITNRDLKLPSEETVAEPIQFDTDGNVKSVTFQTKDNHLVTIENPEKALDLAIQLQADAVGKIPDAAFDKAYKEVEKQVKEEVPVKDISSQSKTDTNGNQKESRQSSSQEIRESGGEGSGKKSSQEGNGKEDVNESSNPLNKGTASEKPGAVSSLEVIEAIDKANQSKKSVREKDKAMETEAGKYGDVGKKALEINRNFDKIVGELKKQNKLEVKCP